MYIGTVAVVSRIRVRKSWRSCTGIANTRCFTYPQKKKSIGIISGERGGQKIGPPRPIQQSGKDSVREFRTSGLECGGAPSCWKIALSCRSDTWGYRNCSNMSSYTGPVIDFSWKKKGPIILFFLFYIIIVQHAIDELTANNENKNSFEYFFLLISTSFHNSANFVSCD